MQPISIKREAQYRGASSSRDLNQWIDDMYYDLVQLFSAANESKTAIDRNTLMLRYHNVFLQKKVASLQAILNSIQATLGTSTSTLIKSFSSTADLSTVEGYQQPTANTDYGVLHLGITQQVSKVHLVDASGEPLVPKSLSWALYESTSSIDSSAQVIPQDILVQDSSVIYALDGRDDTFWMRLSEKAPSVDKLYVCLQINLPTNIMNHLRVNVIYLDPIPQYGLTLTGIKYYSLDEWLSIPTMAESITDMGRTMISFPTRDVSAIRLVFEQANWVLSSGLRIFPYGFHNIDVCYASFSQESNRLRVRYSIPDEDEQFVSISSVTPLAFPNTIDPEDLFTVYGIHVAGYQQLFNLGEVLPALTKEIEVEIGLAPSLDTSPVLQSLKIEYEAV